MAAPTGNQFWKARSSHGRAPIFLTPDVLWEACSEYFAWVEENPLWESKPFAFQGVVTVEPMPKMRAMTISGLCIYLDIARSTWDEYRAKHDFSGIVSRVEEIIRTQKFEGASADLLNPNIIARELGLTEKSDVTHQAGDTLQALMERIAANGKRIHSD
ncbi:DNA-packaging protein [Rhizobium leguminosarum]|uniref:DNA-packaging protein n=1 Tax=Rhizobium leguminosarum TaxID=384 RepID=UPI00103150B2|nr:DNA-packaging protein [Rhizobium leguminosarum]TBG78611.1 DNA-packaging protein [Rhizobium leguminosarum]